MFGRTVLATMVMAAVIGGCGTDDETSGWSAASPVFGADTPEHAAQSFIVAAGDPRDDYTRLTEACRQLAPSIRLAVRFNASVKPSETDCAAGLAVFLFDTGEENKSPSPTKFGGTVLESAVAGDRATVTAAMSYDGAPVAGGQTARILVVKEEGSWWVATPRSLNVMSVTAPPTDAELNEQYTQLASAARVAQQQAKSGREAETMTGGNVQSCPREGASSARDGRSDVRIADGMRVAAQQVPGHDLVEVLHNGDGDQACFELHLAGDVPATGTVQLATLPSGARVAVQWDNGRAVGQRDMQGSPQAVPVQMTREGSTMTLRLAKASLGISGGAYRWAAQLFVNPHATGHARDTDVDSVPDDLTMGETNHYIPHTG